MRSEGKIGANGGLRTSGSYGPATADCLKNNGNIMARSMQVRPTSTARRRVKMIALLLVIGVSVVVVSAMSLAPVQKAAKPNPAEMNKAPPGSPYPVAGTTYDAGGAPLPGCTVVLTDVTKSVSSAPILSDVDGFYMFDLGSFAAWEVGDTILAHAEKGALYGENSGLVGGDGLVLDVTVSLEIPEFPVVALPIIGMVGLFVAVSVISRRD